MTGRPSKLCVLQQLVERANSLYSLPAVAMEVLDLTAQPSVDTRALKECVERDPAMTGKLLRVVNSSMFGLSREVSDLNQALALLGVKPLKLMVLGFSLPKSLFSGLEAKTLSRFWKQALVKAVAARELSQAFWDRAGDEAFIAGLLQELGVLVLIQQLGESYVNFLDQVYDQGGDLHALELDTLGFDHAILSSRLLEHWNLPAAIATAVAVPHNAEQIESLPIDQRMLPQVLHMAHLIAGILVNGRQTLMPELLDVAAKYRGVQLEQIQDLIDQLQDRVELLADVFSVRLDNQQRYREILEKAHEQMAMAAVDVLPELVGTASSTLLADERQQLASVLERFGQSSTRQRSSQSREGAAPSTNAPSTATSLDQPGTDPGLLGRLSEAISSCRRAREEVSLLLLEVDDHDKLLLMLGPDSTCDTMRTMETAIYANSDRECDCLLVTDSRYAVILPQCDRQQAVATAKRLIEELPRWVRSHTEAGVGIQCSAGVATLAAASSNFPPQNLVDSAERCLFAAQMSGGRFVKSIDLW